MTSGERRLEAETYLSSGYGIRAAMEDRSGGWSRFGDLARPWTPPRIKSILVAPEHGVPYLNTSQVFEFRPAPRKWLSFGKTVKAERRLVRRGTILVMASASVGRATISLSSHEGHIISHHFMRVEPKNPAMLGWIYAYLRAPQAQAMMKGSQYASLIRHIEPHHVESLPVPDISEAVAADFNSRVLSIIRLRDEAHELTTEAEKLFARRFSVQVPQPRSAGFPVHVSAIAQGRRRFDAAHYEPCVSRIRQRLEAGGDGFATVAGDNYEVWLPTRFKRVPASDGVWLLESAALLDVNPEPLKRIADSGFGDEHRGRVKAGWVLMARSGQTYGIIGTTVLATAAMEGRVISDDIIRMRPTRGSTMPAGYIATAMSHPELGVPLVKSLAYGSSIPHIDIADVKSFRVVRMRPEEEQEIASLAEAAVAARAKADLIEQEIAREAGKIIDDFIHQPAVRLANGNDGADEGDAVFQALAEKWCQQRPRGANLEGIIRVKPYEDIIALGERAIRPILLRLKREEPDHWFEALHQITGQNPVPPDAEGDIDQMAAAWVRWGKERGYIGDMD